ncbi:MAG: WD40 repeat domain-containing protein [Planctomycetota bacterium]|nr:WD40 repeat domain-containing protein [Planctomycetota bacterium]
MLAAVAFALEITVLAAAPTGAVVALGSSDGSVRVLDLATGESLAVLALPRGVAARLAWSPDGRRIAAAAFPVERDAGNAPNSGWTSFPVQPDWVVWDFAAGRGEFHGSGSEPASMETGLAWSPDGFDLLMFGTPASVRIVRFDELGLVEDMHIAMPGQVSTALWSPDGAHLVLALANGGLVTIERDGWRVAAWVKTVLIRPRSLVASRDARLLLAGSDDVLLGAWCLPDLAPLWSRRIAVSDLWGSDDAVASLAVRSDGELALAVTSTWAGIEAFDPRDGRTTWEHGFGVGNNTRIACRFAPDESRFAIWGDIHGAVSSIRSVEDPDSVCALDVLGPESGAGGLAWTADGRFLVVLECRGARAVVLDARTLEFVRDLWP